MKQDGAHDKLVETGSSKCCTTLLTTYPTKSAARTDSNRSLRDGSILCISEEGKGV